MKQITREQAETAINTILDASGSSIRAQDFGARFPGYDPVPLVEMAAVLLETEFAAEALSRSEDPPTGLHFIPARLAGTKDEIRQIAENPQSEDDKFREEGLDCILHESDRQLNQARANWGREGGSISVQI